MLTGFLWRHIILMPATILYREYWMICRGPGFLAVVWFGSSPTSPFLLPSVISTGGAQKEWERETTAGVKGGRGGGGAKSYDDEKAWSSINHPIRSVSRVSVRFELTKNQNKVRLSLVYYVRTITGFKPFAKNSQPFRQNQQNWSRWQTSFVPWVIYFMNASYASNACSVQAVLSPNF
jgi:hypothetical protein